MKDLAVVQAADEIRSRRKMRIARAGERGKAVAGAEPSDGDNYGRVFVRWNGRKHGYWVEPAAIRFIDPVDPARYIAQAPDEPDEPEQLPPPALPCGSFSFEYDFGRNLRLIRRARSMSQGALVEAMGRHGLPLTQSTVSYRESSPDAPGQAFLRAAARALQVPPFIFLFPLASLGEYDQACHFLLGVSSAMDNGAG